MADMNIPLCVDGRMLDAGATGVGSYADRLVATLARAGRPPLILAEAAGERPGRWRRRLAALRPGARALVRRGERLVAPPGLFAEAQAHFDLHGRPLRLTVDGPPGLMHWTYPVPLRLDGWRNIYTVHDLIPLTRPDLTTISGRRHRRLLAAILAHAHRLLAVSEAGRAELVATLGIDPARIGNCWQAADPLPGTQSLLPPGGFYLFCGTVEPRKNIARLAEAHALSGTRRPLVVVGPAADAALEAMLDARPLVVRLPWQAPATLFAWMRDARALLFPSLAEGFGLPIAEAMMLGTPVMTSDLGAQAEVAGGAALAVDPRDTAAMAAAIARLDADDALAAGLSAAGRARAAFFAPAAYAARLDAFYAGAAA